MTLERLTQITSVGITSGITLNSATLTGVTTLTTASASGNVSAVDGTFSGDLNVAGTLTYEDVSNIDSVGVITARSGLHVTGGSVGIGTDNPAEKLEVYGNVRFKDPDGSHGIEFYPDVAGLGYQRIISYNRTSSAYESLSIGVDNFIVTQGSSSERFRITSSGRIGISSTAPADPLDIADNDPAIRLTDIDGQVYHRIRSSSQDLLIECDDGAAGAKPNLRFQVGNDEKFRVTGVGGSFGIGTNDPQTRFHVNATIDDDDAPQWAFHLTQDDPLNSINQLGGSGIGILFKPATNSDPAIGAGIAAEKPGGSDSDTTTDLVFYTSQNDETLDEAVRIDSSGRVTMPYQPGCSVWYSGTDVTSGTIIYNNEEFNTGSHYNSTNGRFTAPVAGKYLVLINHLSNATSSLGVRLYKNGSPYTAYWAYNDGTTTNKPVNFSVAVSLAASDYLTVVRASGTVLGQANYHNAFTVYLLG